MKRLLLILLAFILLFSVAIASTEYTNINLGEYTYQVPSSWEVVNSDNGFTYIYETGDVLTGVYIASNVVDIDVSPANAMRELEDFMSGVSSNGIEGTCEVLNDLKCDSIGDLPYIAFTYDMMVGTKMEPVVFAWTDYSNIYSICYADMSASFKYVCGNFQPILDTLSGLTSNISVSSDKSETTYITSYGSAYEELLFPVSRNGLDYTMKVCVDDFYRGADYLTLRGKQAKTAKSGYEYMAVKATITFESIDSIDESVVGTDDPEIHVHYLAKFDAYSCVGEDYGYVHSIMGMDEVDTFLHVGETVTGYFEFEVSKDDPAPLFVYRPELNHELYIVLS